MAVTPRYSLRDFDRLNERDARRGIGAWDIGQAAMTGFSAADVETLRLFCHTEGLLLTIRCPKPNTRQVIGMLPPKPMATKTKSDADGIGPGRAWASDYDLMGIFAFARGGAGRRYERIPTVEPTADKGVKPRMTAEGAAILRALNRHMEHPFQHGANDDWCDTAGRPWNGADKLVGARYVAFTETAWVRYMPSFGHLHKFYTDNGLDWPY